MTLEEQEHELEQHEEEAPVDNDGDVAGSASETTMGSKK
jgi:hypothetical protein